MRYFPYIFSLLIILSACGVSKKNVTSKKNNDVLLNKYASKIGVSKSEIKNIKLYSFIDDWYGVKYKYGGMSKAGIDCSGFCNVLYNSVYNKSIKRTTSDLYKDIKKVGKKKLKEGDLVFFHISKKKNSHVGVYLMNNKFVHASSSKGVIISSLDNPYYKRTYSKGGSL